MGVPQNIMLALCAVIRPDHLKFASYGPAVGMMKSRKKERVTGGDPLCTWLHGMSEVIK